MPYREKSNWISIAANLAVWATYFTMLANSLSSGAVEDDRFLKLAGGALLLAVIVNVILQIVAAIVSRQDPSGAPDELEKAIRSTADRVGFVVGSVLMLPVIAASTAIASNAPESFPDDPSGATAMIMANAVLAALVLTSFVRDGTEIVLFRRMR